MNYELRFTKTITILLFFIIAMLFFAFPVSAHVLKTDKEIGAVIHINPDDDPIVGQNTTIYFDIKDKEGKFSSDNCLCIFKVTKAQQDIYMQTLTGTTAEFIFPERNIYTIELKGTPKYEGAFTPFTLTYDIRVERVENTIVDEKENSNFRIEKYFPYVSLIVLVLIIFVTYKYKKK